ncbi:MAG: DUF1592 domain-containing protein [Polyangiales bacterium]
MSPKSCHVARLTLKRPQAYGLLSALFIALFVMGCQGRIVDETADPTNPPLEPGDPNEPPGPEVCDESRRGSGNKHARRLTEVELRNTLRDLFGPSLYDVVATSTAVLPSESFGFHPERFASSLSGSHVDAIVTVSNALALAAASDASFVDRYGECGTLESEECVDGFLSQFMPRALRGPVSDEERGRYLDAWRSEGDVAMLIQAVLLSPRFLMLVEEGEPQNERFRLTDFEIASRISYRAVSTMPDDELWAVAQRGELSTLGQVRVQVERLLGSDAGKAHIRSFFHSWFEVEDLPAVSVSNAYRGDLDVLPLYSDALQDFDRFIDYIVWEADGTFRDLFVDKSVFPTTDALASVYGVSASEDGSRRTATTPHQGIFLRAASLMGGTDHSPIIHRGVMMRQRLLCDELGQPDQEVISARDDDETPEDTDRTTRTNRQVIGHITRRTTCMGCHARINPLGFALENFDSLARWTTEEQVFEGDELVATHPIDARSDELVIEEGGVSEVDGAVELVEAFLQGDKLRQCFARSLLRYQLYRFTAADDGCLLIEQDAILDADESVYEFFVHSIANDDLFWRAR